MNRKNPIYVASLFTLVLATAAISAQNGGECEIRITEPRAGQDVALHGIVQGTAKLPFDSHVWIFVRPVFNFRTLGRWWPQGEAAATTGEWELPATFGSPQQNIGEQFDISAAAFAPQQHAELVAYLEKGTETGKWPPTKMPATICAATIVTVIKRTD